MRSYPLRAVLILALVGAATPPSLAENSIPRFDFSAQANRGDWVVYDWPELESGVAEAAWDAGGLLIDGSQAKTQYGVASWLDAEGLAGRVLRCRVQVRTQGEAFAAVGVAYHRDHLTTAKSRQDFAHSPEYRSDEWRSVEWQATLGAAPAVAVVLYMGGQGRVWFKELQVEVVAAPPQTGMPPSGSGVMPVAAMPWEAEPQDVAANEALYGKRVFHTIEGVPLPMIFRYRGDSTALKDPGLLLDVPVGMRVVGSRCNHFGVFTPERIQTLPSGEPGRQVYRVDQLGAMRMLKAGWGWRRSSAIFLLADRSFEQPVTLRYAENNNGSQAEWKSFEVVVLPPLQPLAGKATVSLIPWHQKDIALPGDAAMLEALLKAHEQAGMDTAQIVRGDEEQRKSSAFEQQLVQRGWTGFMPISDALYDPYKEAGHLQLEKMTTISGKKLDNLCPTYVLETPEVQKAYYRSLEKQVSAFKSAATPDRKPWVALDLELWGEKEVKTACFDERCRAAFAKRLRLPSTPTAQEIISRHLPQWTEFRHHQTDQVSKITADYLHRTHPNIVVAYYDYPIPVTAEEEAKFLNRYPANTRLYDDDLDVHLLSLYRPIDAAFFDLLAHAIGQLNKPVVPITFINNPSSAYSRHSPRQVYMEAMAAGLLGAPGLSLWTGEGVDGAYLSALNRAQIELEPWGSAIRDGKRLDSPRISGSRDGSIRCVMRQHEEMILMAIFNYSADPIASVTVRSKDLAGYEDVTGHEIQFRNLAPQSVQIVSLKKIGL